MKWISVMGLSVSALGFAWYLHHGSKGESRDDQQLISVEAEPISRAEDRDAPHGLLQGKLSDLKAKTEEIERDILEWQLRMKAAADVLTEQQEYLAKLDRLEDELESGAISVEDYLSQKRQLFQ